MKSACLAGILALVSAGTASAAGRYLKVQHPPSNKFGELQLGVTYTLWIPDGVARLRGIIVHQHGCGSGACKGGATAANDLHWQALAHKWDCALLGPSYHQDDKQNCRLWCDPRNGSHKTFLNALEGPDTDALGREFRAGVHFNTKGLQAHGRLRAEKVGAHLDKFRDKPGEGKKSNVYLRGSLTNSRIQFEKKKAGHVAFMGGSITEMNGYRPLVCDLLKPRFPETKFTFTNAGIASTCSTTGAFRLARDVLDKGPVDLFFLEFAVNDDQDAGHARRECIRGMEGIIRHVRAHNPNADIVLTYFVNPAMLKTLQDGKVPLTIASHEEVARHYAVSAINVAEEVADRIRSGTLTWARYGGVHPGRPGNELCAALIDALLTRAWRETLPADATAEKHRLPDTPLDANHYGAGRFIDPQKATLGKGWKLETPDWKKIPGQWRERFRDVPLLCATKAGAELTLAFEGRAIGAYLLAGPDAGIVEFSIDEGPFTKADLFHVFSRGLHYPRTVMFAADLKAGRHTLKLRLADQKNEASSGSAARIIQFVGN